MPHEVHWHPKISREQARAVRDNAHLEECGHRLIGTTNLELEEVCPLSIAPFRGTLGCEKTAALAFLIHASSVDTPEELTCYSIRILKLLFAAKDILYFFLLHVCLFEVFDIQDILVRACTAFETVDAKRILRGGLSAGDSQHIAAVGTN